MEEQVRAYGGPRFQLVQDMMARFSTAVQEAKVDVVPRIVLGGRANGSSTGNALEGLFALLLSEKLGEAGVAGSELSPDVVALRDRLRASVTGGAPEPDAR
ncbi:MAG: hypothetical protein JW751_13170 [Polyangiaceae bacterium]|nr:hypothetical protein [Polyangiaceae bacterium]